MERLTTASLVTERNLQQQIIQVAHLYKWLAYHTYDSRRCSPGFPDLVLCKQANGVSGEVLHKTSRLLFVELKSEKGRLRAEQEVWIDALRAAGQEVHIWRPSDWDEAVSRLQRLSKEKERRLL